MAKLFCSACKHSKYITANGKKQLYCRQREAFGVKPYLPTDATDASECLDFDPERRVDAYKSAERYKSDLHKCGLGLDDARRGRLSTEGPQV